jgi:hypothetical protein
VADGLSRERWADIRRQLDAPFFAAIRGAVDELPVNEWPSLDALNGIAARRGLCNANGRPIVFVTPGVNGGAMQYETQIAETGAIPTRENVHDLFNALQWLSCPKLKSAINSGHLFRLQHDGGEEAKARSTPRDVLTMFDESGVIVASEDKSLLALIREFRWRELFVDRRHDVIHNMRFFLVGHGLLEKSLAPFIGLTAKAMLLTQPINADLDVAAAIWLADPANLDSARNLAPLPLLGIPGWDARNEVTAFYDDATYFRPGYTRDLA